MVHAVNIEEEQALNQRHLLHLDTVYISITYWEKYIDLFEKASGRWSEGIKMRDEDEHCWTKAYKLVSNQGIKYSDEIGNLMWANTSLKTSQVVFNKVYKPNLLVK